jgi:hypothetical protein
MPKSSFNLHASNTGFSPTRQSASGGPHFDTKSGDESPPPRRQSSPPPATTSPWRPKLRAFVLTAALTTALVTAFWSTRSWQRQSLADRWRHELAEADDDVALGRVRQLAQLGPPGAQALGQAIGIHRDKVARAARDEVTALLARCELEEPQVSSPLIAALAQGMAAAVESFDPDARRFAADTAQRLLVWPVDRKIVNRAPLIAACETVLLATGRSQTSTRAVSGATGSASANVGATSSASATGSNVGATGSASETADQPTPAARLLPSSIELRPLPKIPTEATVEVSDEENTEPQSNIKQPETAIEPPTTESPATENNHQPATPPRQLPRASTAIDDTAIVLDDPTSAAAQPVAFSTEQAAWVRDLNSSEHETVAQARAELTKLGLSATEIEIARLSTHADPAVRKRLARAIPRFPDIDARTWLEFLADDPDPEVRRTAQTLLATTGDATAVSRLRQQR